MTPYFLIQRLGRGGPGEWWRPLVGLIVFILGFLLALQVLGIAFVAGYTATGSTDPSRAFMDSITDHVTPAGLAYVNLYLAIAIPIAMAVTWFLHRLPPGWLASVTGRMRWRWMLTCLGLSVITLAVTLAVGSVLPSDGTTQAGGGLNDWTSTTLGFVLVIAFLTPFQAMGEEYAFRGYLTQALGGLSGRRWVAVLVPALLFALAHGSQDLPTFTARFAFGLVAGILVIATGGLEAGIAMHVLNNFVSFGLALAFSNMTDALNPTGGSWWSLPSTLTQSLLYLALVTWAARRAGIATSVAAAPGVSELEGLRPRV